MKKLVMALGAVLTASLLLVGCSSTPDAETRVKSTTAFLETEYGNYIAESGATPTTLEGIWERTATELVDVCDSGSGSPDTYVAQMPTELQPMILEAWDIACP